MHKLEPVVMSSTDPSVACKLLNDRYKQHQMRVLSLKSFDFSHVSSEVPGGTFNFLKYGSAVEIQPEPFNDFFMLEMPLAAGVHIESENRPSVKSDPETALLLPPHVRFSSVWKDGCQQLMLKIENSEILRRWQFLTGDPEAQLPKVHPEIDLTTPEGWRIKELLKLMRYELQLSLSSGQNRMISSSLPGATIDAVLGYYRERRGNHKVGGSYQILPARLRHCIRYIENNLGGDLSIPKLLEHTDVSERTLFNLFQKFLEMTPKAFVQQQRLRNSRCLLLEENVSVSEAAKQSGFEHMGRFASLYRERYGENPSQT